MKQLLLDLCEWLGYYVENSDYSEIVIRYQLLYIGMHIYEDHPNYCEVTLHCLCEIDDSERIQALERCNHLNRHYSTIKYMTTDNCVDAAVEFHFSDANDLERNLPHAVNLIAISQKLYREANHTK